MIPFLVTLGALTYSGVAVVSAKKLFTWFRADYIEEQIASKRVTYHIKITPEVVEQITFHFQTKEMGGCIGASLLCGLMWPVSVPLIWVIKDPKPSPTEVIAEGERKDKEIARLQKELDNELKKNLRKSK